jgi:hypothetical protein
MSEIDYYIGINLAWGCDEETLKGLIEMLRTRPYVDYAVLMANGPEAETPKPEPTRAQLGIIGRERALITMLTNKMLLGAGAAGHAVNDSTELRRGEYFEVLIHVDGEPTGHVARVTAELDHFDRYLAETAERKQGKR